MPSISPAWSIALIFTVAIGSNAIGMMVGERAEKLEKLSKQIADDKSRMEALDIELGFLAGRQRIQQMVNAYRPDMKLPDESQTVIHIADALPALPDAPTLAVMPAPAEQSTVPDHAVARPAARPTPSVVTVSAPQPVMPRLGDELAAMVDIKAVTDVSPQ